MAHDREVGGIRCLEVLGHLSDYLDGEVSDQVRAHIEDHLAGCDWCQRFGGRFTATVTDLRRLLRYPPEIDHDTQRRLLKSLGLDDGNVEG